MDRCVKRRSVRKYCCASIALLALSLDGAAVASPWNREQNHIFLLSRIEYFSARGETLPDQDSEETRYDRVESNDYLEYGLTPRVMVGAKVAYGYSAFSNGFIESTASGFSEVEVFAQYQALRTPNHALGLKIAGGRPGRFEAGVREGLVSDGYDIEASVLYGRSLSWAPIPMFMSAEAGYRKRFGDGADELRGVFAIGAEPAGNLLFLAQAFATRSLRNETPGGADYDVVKLQTSAVYRFARRWSIEAGYRREVAGRNLLLGGAGFMGLWWAF